MNDVPKLADDRPMIVQCAYCDFRFDGLATDGACPLCRITELEQENEYLRAAIRETAHKLSFESGYMDDDDKKACGYIIDEMLAALRDKGGE